MLNIWKEMTFIDVKCHSKYKTMNQGLQLQVTSV